MTIIVGGYIVGFPLGGMTWHHLNYLLGLHELGHEVWFFEDTIDAPPWNPVDDAFSTAEYGIAYLRRTLEQYALPDRYCVASSTGYFGANETELNALLKRADVMICVSGVTPIRSSRPRPKRMLVIDTDPVFTQLRMNHDRKFLDYYKQFDAVATFGRLIGTSECPLPTHGINWIGTHQPISLKHWPVCPAPSDAAFTTIGKWEHSAERHVEFHDQTYHSSKGVEWMKLIDLPRRTGWPLEMAMSSLPDATRKQFESHGWRMVDPIPASIDTVSFAGYVQRSAGELTVAKQIYSALPSGWFSDRSACYLASGKPVITQSTGFERWLPTGEGLFAFSSIESAITALAEIEADYERHARAARRLAEEHFDARIVLAELISAVM